MPVDTVKTTFQVEGEAAREKLSARLDERGIGTLYEGAIAASAATFVGHYPWFLTYNGLSAGGWVRGRPLKARPVFVTALALVWCSLQTRSLTLDPESLTPHHLGRRTPQTANRTQHGFSNRRARLVRVAAHPRLQRVSWPRGKRGLRHVLELTAGDQGVLLSSPYELCP